MAINWTNNGTNNKWNVGDTATFTATGDLPDWIKNGQFNTSVFYVTSDGTTAAATATGDGVTYSGGVLTLTMSINLDINDWTVQVFGTNSSNVLRWPGFGAVSDPWADPGCQADDAESGDLTHQIVRTYEKQDGDSWSAVQSINQPAGGTYRITYNVSDGRLSAEPVTRTVTLPRDPDFVYVPFDIDWTLTVNNPCDSAPWTVSRSNTRLHYRVTDSGNCGGPCNSIQAGTATANISVGTTPVNMSFVFEGIGEREAPYYELMDFRLNGAIIARGHAPGGWQRCAMGPIVQENLGSGPPYLLQANTDYVFSCNFTTADHLYHVGCYYQVDLVFEDA